MSFGNAQTFSPVPYGTELSFVKTRDKRLCVGETVLENPLFLAGTNEVVWKNDSGDFYFSLPLLNQSERNESGSLQNGVSFDFHTAAGIYLGSYTGIRTQLSAECLDATTGIPDLGDINILFSLAEQRLPDLFPGGPQTWNQKIDGYVLRHYEESGITVRVRDKAVEAKGGEFGSDWLYVGELSSVIAKLQSRVLPVTIPTGLAGTYVLDFAPAGDFSPIASGSDLDFAITTNGNLCLEGQVVSEPFLDLDNPAIANWLDNETGLVFRVNLDTVTGTALAMDVHALDGQLLGVLSGTRTGLLATCAGLVADNLDIAAIDELFGLLEQSESSVFPASALTYNQLTGSTLIRYYPESGVLVSIDGDQVSASGGVFGEIPVVYGSVNTLLEQQRIIANPVPELVVPTASLVVSGNMIYQVGNVSPINRQISLARDGVPMPESTDEDYLRSLVEQIMGNDLNGVNLYSFEVLGNTGDVLVFEVFIDNATAVASTVIRRDFFLRFSYTRKTSD